MGLVVRQQIVESCEEYTLTDVQRLLIEISHCPVAATVSGQRRD
jgi:hypothetical protein